MALVQQTHHCVNRATYTSHLPHSLPFIQPHRSSGASQSALFSLRSDHHRPRTLFTTAQMRAVGHRSPSHPISALAQSSPVAGLTKPCEMEGAAHVDVSAQPTDAPERNRDVWELAQKIQDVLPAHRQTNQSNWLHLALEHIARQDTFLAPIAKMILRQCEEVKNTLSALGRLLLDAQLEIQKEQIELACRGESIIANLLINSLSGVNTQLDPETQLETIYLALMIHYQGYKIVSEQDTASLKEWQTHALNFATTIIMALPSFNALQVLTDLEQYLITEPPESKPDSLPSRLKRLIYIALALDTELWGDKETFSKTIQDVGIIAIKYSQMLANVVGPSALGSNNVRAQLLEACTDLQINNRPMTATTAHSQLQAAFGEDYMTLLESVDLDHPIATGSIAGVYRGTMRDGREVAIKIKKPNLNEQLTHTSHQAMLILNFISNSLEEVRYHFLRQGKEVPQWLQQATFFTATEKTTKQMFNTLFMELDLNQEADAMQASRCETPEVFHQASDAIIMEYIDNSIPLSEYLPVAQRVNDKPNMNSGVDHLSTPETSARDWLQNHYPVDRQQNLTTLQLNSLSTDTVQVNARFNNSRFHDLKLNVTKSGEQWITKPVDQTIKFSKHSQLMMAADLIANLFKQLILDEHINADQHQGNTLIAPKSHEINRLVQIDYGLRTTLDKSHKVVARLLMFGSLFRNPTMIARAFLSMTESWEKSPSQIQQRTLKNLAATLTERGFFAALKSDPNSAISIPMNWLDNNSLDIKQSYTLLTRSLLGSFSNIAALQGGHPVTFAQIGHIIRELFFPHIRPIEILRNIQYTIRKNIR